MKGLKSLPIVLWCVLGVALGVSAAVLLNQTGSLLQYFQVPTLPGQFLFILVKISGLLAMALLIFQVWLGLMRKAFAPVFIFRHHKALGVASLSLIALHVLCFVSAASLRNHALALDFLWPNFHGFYRSWLSAGLFGFWLLLLALLAAKLGGRWRPLHWLMLPGLILGILHSLQIGSEAQSSTMLLLYVLYISGLLLTLGLRLARRMSLFRV